MNYCYYFSKRYEKQVITKFYIFSNSLDLNCIKDTILINPGPLRLHKSPNNRNGRILIEINMVPNLLPYNNSIARVLISRGMCLLKPFTKLKVKNVNKNYNVVVV